MINTYVASLNTATLFPNRKTRSKSLKAIGIRTRGEYTIGATSEPVVQQAGADLLASIWGEINTVSPDEASRLRMAAGNGDAMARIQLELIEAKDDADREAIRRDKADIARDVEKYKTPYSFGVAEGLSGW